MPRDLNVTILVGELIEPPVETQGGDNPETEFTIVNRTDEWHSGRMVKGHQNLFNCRIYGPLGRQVQKYYKVGDKVLVQGRIRTAVRRQTDTYYEVVVNQVTSVDNAA